MTGTALSNLFAWSVQAGILTLVAAVVTRLLPIDAPAVRYGWWRAVLVACLVLPVMQPWQPPAFLTTDTVAADAVQPISLSEIVIPTTTSAGVPDVAPVSRQGWQAIAAVALVAGAMLRLVWLGLGLRRLRRLRSAGARADASDAADFLEALRGAGADVRYVGSLRQPVTFGVVRPVVLLPGTLRTMRPDVQRAVLAHELWHVRRRDWALSLGEQILLAILWFHPAIWYLVSRVQSAREEVVDELSILATNARKSYLEALLAFADEPAVYPAAPFIRRRQLFTRMLLISREAVMSSRRIVASSAGMAGVLVARLAAADDVLREGDEVDRLERRAAELGIDAAGIGNLGHQTVDAAHVMARDLE